jgi:UDP-3-O-[3-hydroxymyristoyl] N-acetylglucosamine deacetylase
MKGRGLHTGEDCSIHLLPAEPGMGIVFSTDLGDIPAKVEYVSETRRGTSLRCGRAEIHTVEHLLAAFYGLGVDNARIDVSGPELPAGDGSALSFVELIEQAGIVGQGVDSVEIRVDAPVHTGGDERFLIASPDDGMWVDGSVVFAHPLIGKQENGFQITPEVFKREIAPARTFCTSEEIDILLSQGLGRGGSADNVIVVYPDRYSVPLRFHDEFVRHKILDVIGDLSLIGSRLRARVRAVKSSHTLNVSLADKIVRNESSRL